MDNRQQLDLNLNLFLKGYAANPCLHPLILLHGILADGGKRDLVEVSFPTYNLVWGRRTATT